MASGERDNTFPLGEQERAGTAEQRIESALDERCKSCLDVAITSDMENNHLFSDRPSLFSTA
jgi:hypothetical protein